MRIFLNLLPEEKKVEIKRDRNLKLIIWQGFILFFIVVFFVSMLASINLILKVELNGKQTIAEAEKLQDSFKEMKSREDEFKLINRRISALSHMKNSQLHWINVLRNLDRVVPDEISLAELATDNLKITLIGTAETREDLLIFKDNIDKSDCFGSVNIPISDLMQKEDVAFQIDFIVEDECIRQK